MTIPGQRQYLWRAGDQDGEVIDLLLQPRGDRDAAARFLRRLLKRTGRVPHRLRFEGERGCFTRRGFQVRILERAPLIAGDFTPFCCCGTV